MKKLLLIIAFSVLTPAIAEATSGEDACSLVSLSMQQHNGVITSCQYKWFSGEVGSGHIYGFTILGGASVQVAGVWGYLTGGIPIIDNDVPTRSLGILLNSGDDFFYISLKDARVCLRQYGAGTDRWVACVLANTTIG